MKVVRETKVDYTLMAKSFLGALFFAPGVFVLAICAFLGLLLMVEKAISRTEADPKA